MGVTRGHGVNAGAATPPELLGLVTVWEEYGADWNQKDPDVLSEIFDRVELPE